MKPTVPLKNRISALCKDIEKQENISILFAVENGSRAWRMESENSDYDVRFVFHYPLEKYISLKSPKEVIEKFYDEKGKPHPQKGCYIDLVGFDIFKYLRLLAKSNPTAIEWLKTDIVYHGSQDAELKNQAFENFNPGALVHHYKSLCRQNYVKYIKSGNHVSFKKYLYAFRGLVNARYVLQHNKVPPIEFAQAVKKAELPQSIETRLLEIIKLKKSGKEKDTIANIKKFDSYIESFIKKSTEAEHRKMNPEVLDSYLKTKLIYNKEH